MMLHPHDRLCLSFAEGSEFLTDDDAMDFYGRFVTGMFFENCSFPRENMTCLVYILHILVSDAMSKVLTGF